MSHHLSGLTAWLVQRLSAVYLLVYVIIALLVLSLGNIQGYEQWQALWHHPIGGIAGAMFFLSLLLHAWVGMRDVILDYAGGCARIRLALLTLLGGGLIALGMWALKIILMVMM